MSNPAKTAEVNTPGTLFSVLPVFSSSFAQKQEFLSELCRALSHYVI